MEILVPLEPPHSRQDRPNSYGHKHDGKEEGHYPPTNTRIPLCIPLEVGSRFGIAYEHPAVAFIHAYVGFEVWIRSCHAALPSGIMDSCLNAQARNLRT